MKKTVFIDGENVFFQIFDELRKLRVIKYRDQLVKFDLKWLLSNLLGDGDYDYKYYGTKLQEIDSTPELLERTRRMIDHKRRWVGYLSSQGVEFIEAGRLVIRNVAEKGEEADLTFEEKGVDVRLAVDITEYIHDESNREVILMSSDADLLPVLNLAKKKGASIVNISESKRISDVLAGVSDRVLKFDSKDVQEAFSRSN